MTLNSLNRGFKRFLRFSAAVHTSRVNCDEMLETNEDNLRTGTDKVVARLMSFAYIACYVCYLKTNMPLSISD